jgi:hypothetical protein
MRIAAALGPLALSGCFLFTTGASTQVEDVPESLKAYRPHVPAIGDHHPYGPPGALKAGAWARYRVARAGESALTIGVIRREGERAWIEVVEEGEVRRASARLVGPQGRIEKALFREIGPQGASEVAPQELTQEGEPDAPEPDAVTSERREMEVLGAKRVVVVVRATYRDEALGRAVVDESVWCADVPAVWGASEHGGLVSFAGGRERVRVELAAMGASGYAAVIREPK